MRIMLILLILLLNLGLAVRGQESGLPLCHADQINWAEDASPQIEALGRQLETIQTADDFLQYSRDQLAFRQDLWGAPPLCDPYLEAGVIISRYLSDAAYLSAIEWLGVFQMDSPRLQQFKQLGEDVGGLLAKLVGDYLSLLVSPDPRAEQSDGTLPACADWQLQALRAAKTDEYSAILKAAFAVETVDDLLNYDGEQLAFREKIWNDLPLCAEAFEIAPRIFHISSDFLSAHALAFAGVPFDTNPFYWQLERDIRLLPSWLFDALETTKELTRQLFISHLPSCSPAQLAQLAAIEPPFAADKRHVRELTNTGSMGVAREYALAEIRWRNEHMALFPPCTESIELALYMSGLGSDLVVATFLNLANATLMPDLYGAEVMIGADVLEELMGDLPAVSESASGAKHDGDLPGCTIVQVDSLRRSIMYSFNDFVALMPPVDSFLFRTELVAYAKAQLDWREVILERLPPCAEAIDITLFLTQASGTLTALNTLEYAGLSLGENPYVEEATDVVTEYKQILEYVEKALTKPNN